MTVAFADNKTGLSQFLLNVHLSTNSIRIFHRSVNADNYTYTILMISNISNKNRYAVNKKTYYFKLYYNNP